jgi:hypothetical protein
LFVEKPGFSGFVENGARCEVVHIWIIKRQTALLPPKRVHILVKKYIRLLRSEIVSNKVDESSG